MCSYPKKTCSFPHRSDHTCSIVAGSEHLTLKGGETLTNWVTTVAKGLATCLCRTWDHWALEEQTMGTGSLCSVSEGQSHSREQTSPEGRAKKKKKSENSGRFQLSMRRMFPIVRLWFLAVEAAEAEFSRDPGATVLNMPPNQSAQVSIVSTVMDGPFKMCGLYTCSPQLAHRFYIKCQTLLILAQHPN